MISALMRWNVESLRRSRTEDSRRSISTSLTLLTPDSTWRTSQGGPSTMHKSTRWVNTSRHSSIQRWSLAISSHNPSWAGSMKCSAQRTFPNTKRTDGTKEAPRSAGMITKSLRVQSPSKSTQGLGLSGGSPSAGTRIWSRVNHFRSGNRVQL